MIRCSIFFVDSGTSSSRLGILVISVHFLDGDLIVANDRKRSAMVRRLYLYFRSNGEENAFIELSKKATLIPTPLIQTSLY